MKQGLTGLTVLFLLASMASAATTSSSELSPTNVVVDFDSTSFDSSLRVGDSGIMNLVIKNTGGRRAEDVEVHVPSAGSVHVDRRFYVGALDPGDSKGIPVTVRVDPNAKTGLTAVNVRISYDGYNYAGVRLNNELTTWDVPLRVYGNPSFQITPSQTTYYKDNIGDLRLDGVLLNSVKDLKTTLSSSCLTVMGSSRQYVGGLSADQGFNITYQVKPSAEGACPVYLKMDYVDESGSSASDNITIGLNVEAAGVDFKVVQIDYAPTGPGEKAVLNVSLENVGKAASQDTTLSLSLSEPFVPVDTSEKYVGSVAAGRTVDVTFNVAVSWDAEIKSYSIPLTVDYKVGGTSYSVEKNIGLDVSGQVMLEVISVEQTSGSLRIDVANIGTRAAEGVKAILTTSGGNVSVRRQQDTQFQSTQKKSPRNPLGMLAGSGNTGDSSSSDSGETSVVSVEPQQLISYKSDIKPNKQTTFSFDTTVSGPVTLTLEYAGLNNERVTQVERFTVGSSGGFTAFSSSRVSRGGTSLLQYLLYAVVLLALWTVYRKYRKKSVVPAYLARKLGRDVPE